MADLEEAVVVPDVEGIREQAEKLGYIVKQKGRIEWSPGSAVSHEIISDWDPWHVTSSSGQFGSRQRPYRSRLFNTEAEALALLPEILRNDARSRALEKYEMWVTPWEDGRHFGLHSGKIGVPTPQYGYDSLGDALDAAERAAKEYDDKNERDRLNRLASRLSAHERNMPSRFHGRDLENFNAKSKALKDALEVARQYVEIFQTHDTKCLVLCGDRGTGKTSLAVATAASLTVHDRIKPDQFVKDDLRCQYKTVSEAISEDTGLYEAGVLLLDWCELQTSSTDSHGLADLVGALSGRVVANVLELRYAKNLATLLIADCDQARLLQYLGPSAFAKLRDKSWEIVQVGKAKEATKCQTQ